MNARRLEIPNYTPEQVAEHLRAALAIVAELDVAPDLAPTLIVEAVRLLAAKQIVLEPVAGGLAVPHGPIF